jgi:drug/metabolite transporter (DMT)-like permease
MPPSARPGVTGGLIAATLLVLCANVCFPLQDTVTKKLVMTLPVWEVIMVRSMTALLLGLAIGRGPLLRQSLATPIKKQLMLRGVLMLGGWFCFALAARTLPLGTLTIIYFLSPAIVSFVSGPILGERLTWAQWLAVAAGFGGVALASGLAHFELSAGVAIALLASVCWAGALVMLRWQAQQESALVQMTWSNTILVAGAALGFLSGPMQSRPADIGWMAVAGIIGAGAQFTLYEAASRVPAPVLATLEYSSILVAFLLGYLAFGDVPETRAYAGAALVVASGVLMVFAEHRRELAAQAARPAPSSP